MIDSFEYSEETIFARNIPGSVATLKTKSVGIAGCGGLGSNVAILLARSGIGKLTAVDFDIVAPKNINRQHFFLDQIGQPKVEALQEFLHKINPNLEYHPVRLKLDPDNVKTVFSDVDILIEAFDVASEKAMLINAWTEINKSKPVIGASGVSGIGSIDDIKINRAGNVIIVGDQKSDVSEGLMAPRVMMVASIQATLAIQYFLGKL